MPDNAKMLRRLSALEMPDLIDAAKRLAGFDLGKKPEFATAANVSGVRSKLQSFSQRRDSRTFFAADSRYGYQGAAGAWTGGVPPERRAKSHAKSGTSQKAGMPRGKTGLP